MKREADTSIVALEEEVKNNTKTLENGESTSKPEFIKYSKVKVAIITGYNGINFCGS